MTTPIVVCAECGSRNPAHNDVCGLCNKPLNGPLLEVATSAVVGQAYTELLMAVERKFPDETRHQTALRYIRETEQRANEPSPASQMNPTWDVTRR